MTPAQLDSIKSYVSFGEAQASALVGFHALAAPHFERIVTDFYDVIQAHPGAVAAITGGQAQVARLKRTLLAWMSSVLLGPHDDTYLEHHARIGRVHVRIGLPQEFMFTAMNRIRGHLSRIADDHPHLDDERRLLTKDALHQVLDLELAIMLDTYREDLIEKMRIKERLATLGQLSATIAHELRNPLGTIESSLFLIRRRVDKLEIADSVLARHHDKISDQVQLCGATIESLLELARERPLVLGRIELAALAKTIVASLTVPVHVVLRTEIPADLAVHGDVEQLRLALSNLLGNALDALSGRPRGEVTLRASRDATSVSIDVVDDGPGVPRELASKIFELLFTTKATGTGLGLALAQRVAQAHGGRLALEPTATGAHFRLSLPQSSTTLLPPEPPTGT